MVHTHNEESDLPGDRRVVREARERVRRGLVRLSRTGALPAQPWAARIALERARAGHADIHSVCQALRADVGLCARILRIANASMMPLQRRSLWRIEDAVLEIGLRKTCDVVVAGETPSLGGASESRLRALADHALLTALMSEELARLTRQAEPALAYLGGLFHDVGYVAFALADGTSLAVVDELASEADAARSGLERRWFGCDHATASEILARAFGLPEELCAGIRWHHDPAGAAGESSFARHLDAAERLADGLAAGDAPDSVGIDSQEARALVRRVRRAFDELRRSA